MTIERNRHNGCLFYPLVNVTQKNNHLPWYLNDSTARCRDQVPIVWLTGIMIFFLAEFLANRYPHRPNYPQDDAQGPPRYPNKVCS